MEIKPGLYMNRLSLNQRMIGMALLLALCKTTLAGDRPFNQLSIITNDGDDDRTFSSESSFVGSRNTRSLSTMLEYSVDPTLAFQIEIGGMKELRKKERERDFEFEVRKAFTNPAREGYGIGISTAVEWSKSSPGGDSGFKAATVVVPLSIPFQQRTLWLHGNIGAEYVVGDKTRARWGVGVTKEFIIKQISFIEYSGRTNDFSVASAGMRFYGRRRRTSLDLSVGRHMPVNGPGNNFVQISIGFFDRTY
jgi:hypothetical protein